MRLFGGFSGKNTPASAEARRYYHRYMAQKGRRKTKRARSAASRDDTLAGKRRRPRPTPALPGTPEKIAVLAERARLGQQLFVRGDAVLEDDTRGLLLTVYSRSGRNKVVGETVLSGQPDQVDFPRWLRKHRTMAELTVTELSRLSGLSRDTLYALENGLQDPTLSTLLKLARGLSLSLSELLAG
jgi:DNA-binding XRE family transcriptional regulator